MKYCKPEVHLISAAKAAAQCIDGSSAQDDDLCGQGPGVSGTSQCNTGIAAGSLCKTGDAPGGNCTVGNGQGTACYLGNSPANIAV